MQGVCMFRIQQAGFITPQIKRFVIEAPRIARKHYYKRGNYDKCGHADAPRASGEISLTKRCPPGLLERLAGCTLRLWPAQNVS